MSDRPRPQATLEGQSVRVRPLAKEDIEQVRAWRNSDEVARWHAERDQISAEQQKGWFASLQTKPDKAQVWIIETREGRSLGVIHIKDIHPVHRSGEVGLYIGAVEDRGNFHASEAFYLVLDHGFAALGLHKIIGHYLTENTAARRLNAHFGFVEEGHYREHLFYDGAFHDYVSVGLLEPDFRASAGAKFIARRTR
jgi:RimJ/RimL family protein N-acetyltransferase